MSDGPDKLDLSMPRWLQYGVAVTTAVVFFYFYGWTRVWATDNVFGLASCRRLYFLPIILLAWPFIMVGAMGLSTTIALWRLRPNSSIPGRCAACGYPASGLREPKCPECGGDRFTTEYAGVTFRWRPIVLPVLLGTVAGVIAGEAWLSIDEAAFRRHALAQPTVNYSRPRAWPFSEGILHYRSGVFTSQGD